MKSFSESSWRDQVRILLGCQSYNSTREKFLTGQIGDRAWEGYCRAWEWLSPRLSSPKQDEFFERHGQAAYYAKINKTRAAFGFKPLGGVK